MNPILEKTSAAVLEKSDQRLQPVILKLVEAGKKVMYSERTRDLALEQLQGGADPEAIGSGIAQLAGILFTESQRTAPMEALMPAAVLLLVEALAFLEEAGAVEVTPDLVAESTSALGSSFLQLIGVTPEKLQQMMAGGMPAEGGSPEGMAPEVMPAEQAPMPPGGIVEGAMP